jgi:hypothetical protein
MSDVQEELAAMKQAWEAVKDLDMEAARRVLCWLSEVLYERQPRPVLLGDRDNG